MKKQLLLLITLLFLTACGVKQTRNLLTSGNYDEAIDNTVSNLRSNKDKKGNQDYVYLLEEAFFKAKERDLNSLNLLEQDKNPANLEKIYNTYIQLDNRQEKIKPLLPLQLLKEGKTAKFSFTEEIHRGAGKTAKREGNTANFTVSCSLSSRLVKKGTND